MSGSQTNHSFDPVLFGELDEPVHLIGLNHLKQFVSNSTDVQVTQSKLTFRCLTVTPTRNEPK